MKKILTIAISVYNLEPFIGNTLNSLVSSKYLDALEILVVNDGSKDNSSNIIRQYEEKYPDSITLFDKENEGQGSTYNVTIQNATGIYYRVLDGDDWYDTNILDRFIEFLKTTSSDAIATNMCANADGKNAYRLYNLETNNFSSHIEYGKEYLFNDVCLYAKNIDMHHMTIKTEIVKKIHILQNVSGYSDLEYVIKIVPFINTVTYLDYYVYQYRTGRPGQAISGESQVRLLSMNKIVLHEMIDYYNTVENQLSPEKKEYIIRRLAQCASVLCYIFLFYKKSSEGIRQFNIFDSELKQWNPTIYNRCNFIVKTLRKYPHVFFHFWSFFYRIYKRNKKFL